MINLLFIIIIYDIIIIGASFCHVIKIILFIQSKFSITFGNQKCNGAAPNFIINDNIIIIVEQLILIKNCIL